MAPSIRNFKDYKGIDAAHAVIFPQRNRSRSEFAKRSFHYVALPLWDDTPAKIRELPTLDRFKKQLKAHLKSWTVKHNSLEEPQCLDLIGL